MGPDLKGFPGGTSGKEPTSRCRRHERCQFDPWVRKIPWRQKWPPTPVFLPGESMDRGAWRTKPSGVPRDASQLHSIPDFSEAP